MKRVMMLVMVIGMMVSMQANVFGSLEGTVFQLVDDFEGYTLGARPAGVSCPGPAGGTLDQESNTTTSVKIAGVVGPGNQYYWVQGNSGTSRRGAGFTGAINSIDNTETGVGFFRFQILSTSPKNVSTFMGMHDMTASAPAFDFLTNTTCVYSSINAGFEVNRNTNSGAMVIRTIGGTPQTLKTGLEENIWYNAWIAANNATDTFDLYINVVGGPGDAPGLPTDADKIGTGLSFSKATTNELQGLVMIQPRGDAGNGQSAEAHLDDMYWSVPEPATLIMLGLGGLALIRKR